MAGPLSSRMCTSLTCLSVYVYLCPSTHLPFYLSLCALIVVRVIPSVFARFAAPPDPHMKPRFAHPCSSRTALHPFRRCTESVPPPRALRALSPAVHASASRIPNLSLCRNLRAARPRFIGKSVLDCGFPGLKLWAFARRLAACQCMCAFLIQWSVDRLIDRRRPAWVRWYRSRYPGNCGTVPVAVPGTVPQCLA
eukprot:COSAG02_NODE_2_length_75708_cov_87.013953_5_plen_195_part_00